MLDALFPTEAAADDNQAASEQPPQQRKRSRVAEDEVANLTQIVRDLGFFLHPHPLAQVRGNAVQDDTFHDVYSLYCGMIDRENEDYHDFFHFSTNKSRQCLAPAVALLLLSPRPARRLGGGAAHAGRHKARRRIGRQNEIFPQVST
jgi:hypothetical protein